MEGENGNEQPVVENPDVQALISEVGIGAAPNNTIPDKLGNIPRGDIEKVLGEFTGGKVKSLVDLQNLTGLPEKYQQTQKQYEQLEQKYKANENPFASDYVKRLNDMYKSGASESEIEKFQRAQKLDIGKMTPWQKVSESLSLQNPGMSQEQINAYMANKYGVDSEESLQENNLASAQILMDVKDADNTLKSFIVDSGQTQNERQQALQQQALVQSKQGWTKVFSDEKILPVFKSTKFEVPMADGKNVFGVDFDVPKETKAEVIAQINDMMTGVPVNRESFEYAKNMYQNLVLVKHSKQIMSLIIAKAMATATREQQQHFAGFGDRKGQDPVPPADNGGGGSGNSVADMLQKYNPKNQRNQPKKQG